jgi:hypothetical protein
MFISFMIWFVVFVHPFPLFFSVTVYHINSGMPTL